MTLQEKLDSKEIDLVIFDCDGTLYRMDNKPFPETSFYKEIRQKAAALIESVTGCSNGMNRLVEIEGTYGLELSLAFKEQFNLSVPDYFRRTWGEIDPARFVDNADHTRHVLTAVANRSSIALLTNAPEAWCNNVLEYIGATDLFKDLVWTGEGAVRKPNVKAFQQVMAHFGATPGRTAMVGDEEKTDILPCSMLGMYTVRVNPHNKETVADQSISSIAELIG
jgi:FMN phosphatase YigB (HAD superfamily)